MSETDVVAPATYAKRRRIPGWTKPDGAISCTRGERHWGNPFRVINPMTGVGEAGTQEESVEMYRQMLRGQPDVQDRARRELAGKILMCWCAPGQTCHVQDVLLPLVNDGVLP